MANVVLLMGFAIMGNVNVLLEQRKLMDSVCVLPELRLAALEKTLHVAASKSFVIVTGYARYVSLIKWGVGQIAASVLPYAKINSVKLVPQISHSVAINVVKK